MNSRISTELSTLTPSLCLKIPPLAPPHSDSLFFKLSELHSCLVSSIVSSFFKLDQKVSISSLASVILSALFSLPIFPWPLPGPSLGARSACWKVTESSGMTHWNRWVDSLMFLSRRSTKYRTVFPPHKTRGVYYREDLYKKEEKRGPWAWLTCFNVTERREDQYMPTYKGTYTNTYFQEELKPCLRHLFILLLSLKLWNMWLSWGAVTLPNAWI